MISVQNLIEAAVRAYVLSLASGIELLHYFSRLAFVLVVTLDVARKLLFACYAVGYVFNFS